MLKVVERDGWLYVSGMIDGKRIMKSTRLRKGYERDAEVMRVNMEAKALAKAAEPGTKEATFKEVAKAYQKWRELEGRTAVGDWFAIGKFVEQWGDMTPSEITAMDIQEFMADEFSHIKPGTVRRYLKMLRAVSNYGKKMGMCKDVPTVPMPRVDDARDTHLNLEEIDAFLEWAKIERPRIYPGYVLLIDTGMRLGELMALEFRDVRGNELHVRKKDHGKSKGRTVPLSDRAKAAVDSIRMGPSDKVFTDCGVAVSPWRGRYLLSEGLSEGCRFIGAPRLRVHDLRHTFAYQAAMHGADLGDLQQMLGHKTLAMTLRYRGFIKSRASSVVKEFGRVQKTCDESVLRMAA